MAFTRSKTASTGCNTDRYALVEWRDGHTSVAKADSTWSEGSEQIIKIGKNEYLCHIIACGK